MRTIKTRTATRPRRALRAANPCRVTKITAAQFRELRLSCVASIDDVAKILHVTSRTVHNWEAGATRVPYAAYKLLRVLRNYELPGEAWHGWTLARDVLLSPEGHRFRPEDGAWWGLVVAQARQFRVLLAENRRLREAAADSAATTTAAVVAAPALSLAAGSETLEPRSISLPLAPNPAFAVGTSFNKYLKGQTWRHSGVTLAHPLVQTVCAPHDFRGVSA